MNETVYAKQKDNCLSVNVFRRVKQHSINRETGEGPEPYKIPDGQPIFVEYVSRVTYIENPDGTNKEGEYVRVPKDETEQFVKVTYITNTGETKQGWIRKHNYVDKDPGEDPFLVLIKKQRRIHAKAHGTPLPPATFWEERAWKAFPIPRSLTPQGA